MIINIHKGGLWDYVLQQEFIYQESWETMLIYFISQRVQVHIGDIIERKSTPAGHITLSSHFLTTIYPVYFNTHMHVHPYSSNQWKWHLQVSSINCIYTEVNENNLLDFLREEASGKSWKTYNNNPQNWFMPQVFKPPRSRSALTGI